MADGRDDAQDPVGQGHLGRRGLELELIIAVGYAADAPRPMTAREATSQQPS